LAVRPAVRRRYSQNKNPIRSNGGRPDVSSSQPYQQPRNGAIVYVFSAHTLEWLNPGLLRPPVAQSVPRRKKKCWHHLQQWRAPRTPQCRRKVAPPQYRCMRRNLARDIDSLSLIRDVPRPPTRLRSPSCSITIPGTHSHKTSPQFWPIIVNLFATFVGKSGRGYVCRQLVTLTIHGDAGGKYQILIQSLHA
jgi:hypothetical protein